MVWAERALWAPPPFHYGLLGVQGESGVFEMRNGLEVALDLEFPCHSDPRWLGKMQSRGAMKVALPPQL